MISPAELCGNGHYRMKGYLTVETKEDYQKWLDENLFQEEESDEWDEWDDEEDDSGVPENWSWAWEKLK